MNYQQWEYFYNCVSRFETRKKIMELNLKYKSLLADGFRLCSNLSDDEREQVKEALISMGVYHEQ